MTFLAFLAFGSPGFFVLLVLMMIFMVIAVESESPFISTLIVGVFFVSVSLGSEFNPIKWAAANWVIAIIGFLLYTIAGLGWSVHKWVLLVKKKKREILDRQREIKAQTGGYGYTMPKFREHKSQLAAWIAYWPFSMFWWAIYDWFDYLTTLMKNIYHRATLKVFEDMDDELKEKIGFYTFKQDDRE